MKKRYITPTLQATWVAQSLLQTASNTIGDDGNATINPGTMQPGDGGDAVKRNYDVWDDDWSR